MSYYSLYAGAAMWLGCLEKFLFCAGTFILFYGVGLIDYLNFFF